MTAVGPDARDRKDHRLPATGEAPDSIPYDPLKLCIFATVAGLGWLLGPVALLAFSVLGLVGYTRARRAGLTTSKCLLRDTRLVLLYLAVLAGLAGWGLSGWSADLSTQSLPCQQGICLVDKANLPRRGGCPDGRGTLWRPGVIRLRR